MLGRSLQVYKQKRVQGQRRNQAYQRRRVPRLAVRYTYRAGTNEWLYEVFCFQDFLSGFLN